jgi:hypothetical protein
LLIEIVIFSRGSSCRSKESSHEIMTELPLLKVMISFFIVGGRLAIIKVSGENIE